MVLGLGEGEGGGGGGGGGGVGGRALDEGFVIRVVLGLGEGAGVKYVFFDINALISKLRPDS